MSIRSIDLDLLKINSTRMISRRVMEEIHDPRLIIEDTLEALQYSLTGFIAAENMGRKEVTRYPANWLEAVKERWLPDWAKKSWPVQYSIKEVEMKILYPGLAPSVPDRDWRPKATMRVYVNKMDPDEWGKWINSQWNEFKEGLTP